MNRLISPFHPRSCTTITTIDARETMRKQTQMYTIYTDSHTEMYERFLLPSIPDSFRLTAKKFDQTCPTGEYYSEGWTQAVSQKTEVILDAIKHVRNTDGPDYFVYTDCDIQFYEDFSEDIALLMKTHDFVAIDDNMYCTGLFAIRADDRAELMWKWIGKNISKYGGDQLTCNAFLRKHERAIRIGRYIPRFLQPSILRQHTRVGSINCGLLPRFQFMNYMHLGAENHVWDGKTPYTLSDDQLDSKNALHANYTIGIENKIKLLEQIGDLKSRRARSLNKEHGSPIMVPSPRIPTRATA
jgi:hypothetical protein